MPRPKKQPQQPGEFSQLEGQTVPIVASGAGNLSEDDLRAIRGEATETAAGNATFAEMPPAEISLAARILTLEGRMDDLERAMESWAARMRTGLRHAVDAPAPTHPATPEEETACAKTNLALLQQNLTPYDGIQAWRDAGSPKMEPQLPKKVA